MTQTSLSGSFDGRSDPDNQRSNALSWRKESGTSKGESGGEVAVGEEKEVTSPMKPKESVQTTLNEKQQDTKRNLFVQPVQMADVNSAMQGVQSPAKDTLQLKGPAVKEEGSGKNRKVRKVARRGERGWRRNMSFLGTKNGVERNLMIWNMMN